MSVDMNTFWSDWGVACGNQTANNWYDCFNGLTMVDGFVCANFQDFLKWNNINWGTFYNRYSFFKDYNNVGINIIDERSFYSNTSDINIWDFKTFYEYAPQYFPLPCFSPDPHKYVIAFRNNNKPFKSYDGVNWSNIITDTLTNYSTNVDCSTSNIDYIWMGGSRNIIRYDKNTQVWKNSYNVIPPYTVPVLHKITYNDAHNQIVGITNALTDNIHVMEVNDPLDVWTTYTVPCSPTAISYLNGVIFVTDKNGATNKRVWTTTDYIVWTQQTTNSVPYDGGYNDIVIRDNTAFIYPTKPNSGTNRVFCYSDDLINWVEENVTFGSFDKGAYNSTDNIMVGMSSLGISGINNIGGAGNMPINFVTNFAPTNIKYSSVEYSTHLNLFIGGGSPAPVGADYLVTSNDGVAWNTIILPEVGIVSNVLIIE